MSRGSPGDPPGTPGTPRDPGGIPRGFPGEPPGGRGWGAAGAAAGGITLNKNGNRRFQYWTEIVKVC